MPPKSDDANAITTANSGSHNDKDGEKLPLKQRLKNLIEHLRLFIYNKEHETFFGNSSSSWIKLSVYYLFFYICLGLFYSGMIAVFGAIVSRESPTYTYQDSQLSEGGKLYIGMSFRPMPDVTDTSITVYNDTASQNKMISSITTYRTNYLTQYDTTYLSDCSPSAPASELLGTRSCRFSWTDIVTTESHPCSATNSYGWAAGQPCILVKLNKIYGWVPTVGNIIDKVVNATNQPVLAVDQRTNNIYITCNGTEPVDTDAMGNIVYYSILHPLGISAYGGIPYYFFPYLNSKDYVQPFVLVQFTSLTLNQIVNVQCFAWAPNIDQSSEGTQSHGMTEFNLYRSNSNAPSTT